MERNLNKNAYAYQWKKVKYYEQRKQYSEN